MNFITQEEVDSLNASQNEEDWNKVCDAVKAARNGRYPADWFTVVMFGGIMAKATARWQKQ
jgi:hypothetical protein